MPKQVIRITMARVLWSEVEMHNTTRDLRTDSHSQTLGFILQNELNSNRSSTTEGILRDQPTRRAMDMDKLLVRSTLHSQDGDLIQSNLAKKNGSMIQMQRSKTY